MWTAPKDPSDYAPSWRPIAQPRRAAAPADKSGHDVGDVGDRRCLVSSTYRALTRPHAAVLQWFRYLELGRPRHCFFFNDTATTEIYTLSLHDALPIHNAHQPDTVAL